MNVLNQWGAAVITSLTNAVRMIVGFIPNLIGFLLILLVGYIVAKLLQKAVVALLNRFGFERFSERTGIAHFEQQMGVRMNTTTLLGKIVYWFVFLLFLVPALNALGLPAVSNLVGQIVGYLPNVFVAIVVLFIGLVLANILDDVVRGAVASSRIGNPNLFAAITRYAIIGFTIIIALYQLDIAPAIIQTLFTAVVGALALAAGLAFGLGGRDSAQRLLMRGENRLSGADLSQMQQGASSHAAGYSGDTPMPAGTHVGSTSGGRGSGGQVPQNVPPRQQSGTTSPMGPAGNPPSTRNAPDRPSETLRNRDINQ